MDNIDRTIVNEVQGGFPVSERPFAEIGERLGIGEEELIARVQEMVANRVLSRFGPLYRAEEFGGGLTLAAMRVPDEDFERVAKAVNALPEVAHNYARDHEFNMWFVVATETPEQVPEVIREIEARTGCEVFSFPKLHEFFVGLRFTV